MLRTLTACVVAFVASLASAQPADLIVVNAKVWTGDPDNPTASALAVRDGRFVAITDGDLDSITGPRMRVIDAKGARVLPGLIDAHVHLGGAAAEMVALDLRPATSKADLLERLRRFAETMEQNEWVLGARWTSDSWNDPTPPSAEEIDKAVGGRPASLGRMDGHQLLASTAALRIAGINADGPADPPGGRIGRRADGAPTGELFEEAMRLVRAHIPALTDAQMRRLLVDAANHAAKNGVTRVGTIDSHRTITRQLAPLARLNRLPIRVHATVSEQANDTALWKLTLGWAAPRREIADGLSLIGFKGYMDGTLGSRTAWMAEPFHDNPETLEPDNAGFPLSMAGDGSLKDHVLRGAALGAQPIVHAIGDKANHTLLDWFAEIPERDRRDVRPAIEHAQHLLAEDIPRFAELGVVASMQPLHKADDGRYAESRIGPARVQTSYAFRDLLDAGAVVAFGSDWPVVDVNPFLGIWAAVASRTTEGAGFLPEQAITIEEALTCYTRHAAYKLHAENEAGTIEVGKSADFILLDRDILSASDEELKDTRVLVTVVGGEVVFDGR